MISQPTTKMIRSEASYHDEHRGGEQRHLGCVARVAVVVMQVRDGVDLHQQRDDAHRDGDQGGEAVEIDAGVHPQVAKAGNREALLTGCSLPLATLIASAIEKAVARLVLATARIAAGRRAVSRQRNPARCSHEGSSRTSQPSVITPRPRQHRRALSGRRARRWPRWRATGRPARRSPIPLRLRRQRARRRTVRMLVHCGGCRAPHVEGDQVDVDRVEHELDGHEHEHCIAPGEHAVDADAEQQGRQHNGELEVHVSGSPAVPTACRVKVMAPRERRAAAPNTSNGSTQVRKSAEPMTADVPGWSSLTNTPWKACSDRIVRVATVAAATRAATRRFFVLSSSVAPTGALVSITPNSSSTMMAPI